MIVFLAMGVLLGAVSVVFLVQNVAVITVTFMSWQITAPLAFVLFGTLLCGALIISLMLIPSLIRDSFRLASIKRQKRELEAELAELRAKTVVVATPEHVA